MKSAEVRLQNLSKQYHRVRAVDDVSLTIEPGSLVALLGPSGCGKSTCLRMIAGLTLPTSGDIFVNGVPVTDIPAHKRNIGMLFQNYALFPHMTVAENIAFGLEMRGIDKADTVTRVRNALGLVRLHDFGERFPAQLSGGQQQRVALARALVIEPSVLLLDEPLGALDKGLRENMQVELRALQRRLGVTTVMVTHDQDEALTMADLIVVMKDGHLEQVGSAGEVYQRPTTQFVATFLGASNLFSCRLVENSGQDILVETSFGLRMQVPKAQGMHDTCVVSVRPEAVWIRPVKADEPSPAPNTTQAKIEQIIYRGFITHFYLRLPNGDELIAYQQNQTLDLADAFREGDAVIAGWDVKSNHVIPNQ